MTRGTEGKCSMLPRLLSAYMGTIQKSQLVRAEEQCEGMVNAQLLWKQLNTLYITSDLLLVLFSLRVHSSQYSHPLTSSTAVISYGVN